MTEFTAAVENYDRFMGRYATGLAPKLADAANVRPGMRVLDVGCGPGALTVELAGRVGEGNVAAIDPTPHFVAACRARVPGAPLRFSPPIAHSRLVCRFSIRTEERQCRAFRPR